MTHTLTLSLFELAERTKARVEGNGCALLTDVAPLDEARPGSVSFLGNPRYAKQAAATQAGAVFVTQELAHILPAQCVRLIVDHPTAAFQTAVEWFVGSRRVTSGFTGIHPTAVIHPTVKLGEDVSVQPYAVIDAHVTIGAHTVVGPHVSIGPGAHIGQDCHLHAHSVVREQVRIGDHVTLQPGAVIGACGFGYHTDPSTGQHYKLDQIGTVVVEDHVEIGANSTVDRARFQSTQIGRGSKIDNLVQIGHNVDVGPDNLIVAQVGLSGSCKTGARCIIGGQGAVVGHITLGDDVILTARAAASKDLTKGIYSGAPAIPHGENARQMVFQRQLPKWIERLRQLEAAAVENRS